MAKKGLQQKSTAPNRKPKAVKEPKKGLYSPLFPTTGGRFDRPGSRKS